MGHVKYGPLPKTRPWREIVALLGGGADAAQLATAAVHAAHRGLREAANDAGAREACWLLVRIPLAARAAPFERALRAIGLEVPNEPDLVDIAVAYSAAVDAQMPDGRGRTDVAEMAQTAGVETLNATAGGRSENLFGVGPLEVRRALAGLATKAQFGRFARPFFARFAFKLLAYLLSRALPDHVGAGRRFRTQAEHERFTDALRVHCDQATGHHTKFAGGWFHLHNFESEGQIERDESDRFFGYAMTKLIEDVLRWEGPNGD